MAKQKKVDYRPTLGFLAIALVVSIGAFAWAQTYGNNVNVSGDYNDYRTVETSVGEVDFGSTGLTVTGTPDLFSGFTSINIEEELRFGDANTKTDEGISEWLVVRDFVDGTTTPVVFQNTYGETIFLREMGLQILGKATTSVRIGVTTSTDNFITSDDQAFLFEDAGTMSLMRTLGNAFGADDGAQATGTIFWLTLFPGTNTHVGASELPLEIKPDIYFLVHATSSNGTNVDSNYGITGSDNTFDGELYLKLERVD